MDRRAFLSGGAGLALAAGLPLAARAETADQALDALLSAQLEKQFDRSPEQVTSLGLDRGARADQRALLDDRSPEAAEADRREAIARLDALKRVDRAGLSPAGRINYDVAEFRLDTQAAFARSFPYHAAGIGRPGPYVVSQLYGAYFNVPDFLSNQHRLETTEDASAYVSRVIRFGTALDQETARVRANAERGVIAPTFVLTKAIGQLRQMQALTGETAPAVQALARKGAAIDTIRTWTIGARAAWDTVVRPAAARQIAALEALLPRSTDDAGVWRLPDGEAYYAACLRNHTTTTLSAAEIHRTGREQVAELQARIDDLLKAQGYTQGTVGQRLNALNREERFLWPNTDQGRADLLASLNAQMADLQGRLPRAFRTIPKAQVEIRRVPVEIQQGAPGGYYQAAPLDLSRPGAYYINLKDTHEWPKWSLPTLTYHEASPGHHFQVSIAREAGELPLYRRIGGFAAFNEGWALYAERVADELGVYESDPFGKIGYLQSYLFRAVRLVVDTGLHAERWTREQAIAWMVENAAEPEGSAVREIERYCVMPGQACSYKIGQTVIANLRAEEERRRGAAFDVRAFHDTVLLNGSIPLSVLERLVRG